MPFLDSAANDYRITNTIGVGLPRDQGVDLGSPFDFDPRGIRRGADGTWDVGAFEVPATSGSPPSAPKNLRVQ